MKRYVIFDLDGTLLDTLEDLADALNYALGAGGYPPRSLEEVRAFVGNGIRNLVGRGVPAGTPEEETEAVFAAFKPWYQAHCLDKTAPYAGIMELLGELKARGVRSAVVSNKADGAVQALCARFFPGAMDFAVGEREGVRRKPAPDTVFAALEALGAKGEEAVYVGDSEVDIQTARNAGMACISVTWGFRDREALAESGAEVLCDAPGDLLKLL